MEGLRSPAQESGMEGRPSHPSHGGRLRGQTDAGSVQGWSRLFEDGSSPRCLAGEEDTVCDVDEEGAGLISWPARG